MPESAVTEEQAKTIAVQAAKTDAYRAYAFQAPYVDSVSRLPDSRNWVVKLLSQPPSDTALGAQYLYVTIDADSGEILAVDGGGGS